MAKAVAKKAQTDAANYEYGDDIDSGYENTTAEDYAVPFLMMLQKMSPEVDKSEEAYIKGAAPGMILNKGTGEIFNKILFVCSYSQHMFIEWVPRDQGGGLVARYEPDDPFVQKIRKSQKFGMYATPDGNNLVDTFYMWGILIKDDESTENVVIGFKSTQIKKYKNWRTRGRTLGVPLFAQRWLLKSIGESNSKGSFHSWDIQFDGDTALECRLPREDPYYLKAKALYEVVKAGNARMVDEEVDGTGEDDEIPFD